ncbi:MAG: hypothetical protein ACOZF0_02325 [Thermodesulfobacteriota bacterium]
MKGFFRTQEENLAARLLQWKYQRAGIPLPDPAAIRKQAERIVDEAHRIARERGRNVAGIIKELIGEIGKK